MVRKTLIPVGAVSEFLGVGSTEAEWLNFWTAWLFSLQLCELGASLSPLNHGSLTYQNDWKAQPAIQRFAIHCWYGWICCGTNLKLKHRHLDILDASIQTPEARTHWFLNCRSESPSKNQGLTLFYSRVCLGKCCFFSSNFGVSLDFCRQIEWPLPWFCWRTTPTTERWTEDQVRGNSASSVLVQRGISGIRNAPGGQLANVGRTSGTIVVSP